MKKISKISNTPEWIEKLAGELDSPHSDGYFDEIIAKLSEEELRNALQQILIKIDDSSVFKEVLKELGLADNGFEKHSEENHNKEKLINPDKAIIEDSDEHLNDANINY